MTSEQLNFRKEEFIGIITLNRPDRGNAITAEIAAGLREISEEIGWDSDVRVLVVTGAGADFCRGADPEACSTFGSREELIAGLSVASIIGALNRPVIAAVNGDALGQGLELALACDLRISSESARFALNQVIQGEMPWDGGTQRLPRLIGRTRSLEMILLARSVTAQEALKMGLVNRVLPPEKVLPEVMSMARELADKGPMAVRLAKEAIHKGLDLTLEQGLRLEADLYFLLHTTHDRAEGIEAFRAKRPPRFTGK